MLDQRIGMNMLGDMNKYTQYQVAHSLPIAAANEGGGGIAGIGVGLGAGPHDGEQHDQRDAARRTASAGNGSGCARCGPAPAAPPLRRRRRSFARTAASRFRAHRSSARSADSSAINVIMSGLEWIVEAHGCDAAALTNRTAWRHCSG